MLPFENFTSFLHSDTYTDLGGKDLLCIDGQQFGNYFFDASFLGYYANGTRPDDPDTPEWAEIIFNTDAAGLSADAQELFAEIREVVPVLGSWNVEIPVRLIRHID